MTEITREVHIEYAHRVPLHTGKCKNIHGHRGVVRVTMAGEVVKERGSDQGMVLDFAELDAVMRDVAGMFDHRLLVADTDMEFRDSINPRALQTATMQRNDIGNIYAVKGIGWIQEMDGPPTAENLAALWYRLVSFKLGSQNIRPVSVSRVYFEETAKSHVVYVP